MKLALICPIPHLDKCNIFKSNYHLILTHLCLSDEKYLNHYINLKKNDKKQFIVLDNSSNEGDTIKGFDLLNMAKKVSVNEVIAPDKYHDTEFTLSETFTFVEDFYKQCKENNMSIMAVPQGEDSFDYINCFSMFLSHPLINTIGIGYRNLIPAFMDVINETPVKEWESDYGIKEIERLIKNLEENTYYYTMSRLYFIRNYVNFNDMKRVNKKIHLLGLYNPYELSLYKKMFTKEELKYIRGCDSAAPFQAAQVNYEFVDGYGVRVKPKAFLDFNQTLNIDQKMTFEKNIIKLKRWAGRQ